jgi:hypothetical protein
MSKDSKLVTPTDKRRPPNAGKGRPKGSINKATKALKDMILGALDGAGGQKYLQRQADENPAAFMTLIGKVLPTTLAGDPDTPLIVKIERVIVDDAQD